MTTKVGGDASIEKEQEKDELFQTTDAAVCSHHFTFYLMIV